MRLAIVSTGHTKFGKLKQGIEELMLDVCNQALSKANTDIDAVDAIYISNFSSSFTGQCASGILASKLELTKK